MRMHMYSLGEERRRDEEGRGERAKARWGLSDNHMCPWGACTLLWWLVCDSEYYTWAVVCALRGDQKAKGLETSGLTLLIAHWLRREGGL